MNVRERTFTPQPGCSDHGRRTPMKFVIPGGSGQVGSVLTRALRADGQDVVVLTRNRRSTDQTIHWDGKTLGPWVDSIDGADVVINLAGHTVNCRYNSKNRSRILNSRIDSTRVVGEAIRIASRPPRLWLQAATATIYAHRYDAPNEEASGIIGGNELNAPSAWNFSIEVATAWERAFDAIELLNTRKLKLRSAMIMSPDRGGIFDTLLWLVRWGLGGRAGDGRQYVSWIHYRDFVRAIYWLIEHHDFEGVANIAAPNPLPNAKFMQAIRSAWGIQFGLPATKWMLEIGARILQTETELILKSRRVVPGLLTQKGFSFQFPNWTDAAESLCREWRACRGLAPCAERNRTSKRRNPCTPSGPTSSISSSVSS